MKYWFIIRGSLPEEVARALWDKLVPYRANLTVLFDKTYVYGDADEPYMVEAIAKELAKLDYVVERG